MTERPRGREKFTISPERQALFTELEQSPYEAEIYRLGDRFEGLPDPLARVTMLDVTQVPGAHYGVANPFPGIIRNLEENGVLVGRERVPVSPDTAILFEASTGNGWVPFCDTAEPLRYKSLVVMPAGMPEARYHHPNGKPSNIKRVVEDQYVSGLAQAQEALLAENPRRLAEGEKIYVTPNHAITGKEVTLSVMSKLGKQLEEGIDLGQQPTIVISMGNGASLAGIGEYIKGITDGNGRVVATESFAYGGGYDRFAAEKGLSSYQELFGIAPGHPDLMKEFSAYGTNAPIGAKLPLQERAIIGCVDVYSLFTDDAILKAYNALPLDVALQVNASHLPNYRTLPPVLYDTFGNSTLGNIVTASYFTSGNEPVVAMAYDGRDNY